jgi:phage terminase small subunit
MPTPPKPFSVLKSEKKSHRTKEELKQREKGESALATGVAIRERPEVKENPIAHKEFQRINKLLKNIEKNDAIYEGVINRYCLIYAECKDFEEKREQIYNLIGQLKETFEDLIDSLEIEERAKELRKFSRNMADLSAAMIELDKQVQSKRKMLLDIEKENIMTVAAALRSIPKKVDTQSNKEKLLRAINGNQ